MEDINKELNSLNSLNLLKIKNIKLNKFYKFIKKNYNDDININKSDMKFEKTENIIDINILKNNRFFSDEIFEYVKGKLIYCYIIKFMNTDIYFFTEYIESNINKNCIKIINNICKLISIMRNIFNNNKYLKIEYFDCKLKKQFPNKIGKILNENNCNSGFSYINRYYMVVYRREEYRRVIIHELLHTFLADYYLIDGCYNELLSKYFCLNNDENININETYTEIFATIINLIYIMIEKKIDERKIDEIYKNELSYSILVFISILKYYGYKDVDELKRRNKKCNKIFIQKTSVFNYYILKPFMLLNIDKLLVLNNRCSNNFIFSETTKCLENFYKLIINNFENKDFKKLINKLLYNKKIKNKSLSMVFYK
jgi:hypothetical protein